MKVLVLLAMAAPVETSDNGARIIAAAKAGQLAAFESLMRQHQRLVLVTAVRLLGKLEDAQDASQEVFLRLYRNLGKIDAVQNVPGWLYRVTVNVCHDMTRKRPASVPVEELPELAATGVDASGQLAGGRLTPFRVRSASLDGDGSMIRLDSLHAGLRVPLRSTSEKPNYVETGISTDVVDVKEGQKLVVGRSSLNGSDTALFLVLIAKIAQ